MEYDSMNREIRRTEKDGSVTRNFYDKNGQLVKTICPNAYAEHQEQGDGLQYTYDTMGRLREKRASGRKLLSFVYDRNGNLTA